MKKKIILILFFAVISVFITGCGQSSYKPNPNAKLERIILNVDEEIALDAEEEIKVEYVPTYKNEEVSWTSSDESVITIDNGKIKGISVGEATIKATTTSGVTQEVNIKVYKPGESLSLNETNIELYVGDTKTINATLTPEDATFNEILYLSSDDNVASINSDGVITAKEVGTATITAFTYKENLKATCEVNVKEKPIEYTGAGNKVITGISLPRGLYKAVLNYSGGSNFIVKYYPNSSDDYDLIANEIGSYHGEAVVRDGSSYATQDGMLEIKASGKWTIKFEKISGSISLPYSGKGTVVSGFFEGTGERKVITLSNSGRSNFIVKLYDEYGDYDLVANEIGTFNGETVIKTSKGTKYYFEVISSGSWSIS